MFAKTKLEAVTIFCLVYSVKMMIYSKSTAKIHSWKQRPKNSANPVEEAEINLKQSYCRKFVDVDTKLKELMEGYITSKVQKIKSQNTQGAILNLKKDFADGAYQIISNSKLGESSKLEDYCYIPSRGKWVPWMDVKMNRNLPISQDIQMEVFDRDELTRLNCVNKKAMIHALAPDTTDH